VPVHGATLVGKTDKSGRLSHRAALAGKNGKEILLPSGIPLRGDLKEQFKEHGVNYSARYARWSDISQHKPDVWLIRPDNLYVSLYQWKSGPLQRLAKLLASKFFESKWTFQYNGKDRKMPDSMRDAHKFFGAAVQEFPFWKDDLKVKLQTTLSSYIGRNARMELSPSLKAIEEWLAEQLLLSFAADAGGALTPLPKMGLGWQSLVRIAALEVLSQYPDEVADRVVLLFEEPESYLHPHFARRMRGVLERLASTGWTVVLTTHSTSLVSFGTSQQILRLRKFGDQLDAKSLLTKDVDGAAKFQERIDERGGHELLFATKAVLCEGQDDVFAIKSFLEYRRKVDLDSRSVSIVRTGDVNQLAGFAAMATKLGIPWCAVSDEDRAQDGSQNKATASARLKVEGLASKADASVTWPGDLEQCLGKTKGKATPEWQAAEIEPKNDAQVQREHPAFWEACSKIEAWITAA
jgi:hypothetical protein